MDSDIVFYNEQGRWISAHRDAVLVGSGNGVPIRLFLIYFALEIFRGKCIKLETGLT